MISPKKWDGLSTQNFNLQVEHTPRGYEKVCYSHNQAFLGELSWLPSWSQNGLRKKKNQGRATGLGFYSGEEVGWDKCSHMCKLISYGLNFPLMPKESTLRLSYQLAQMWYSREGEVIRLETCQELNIKTGVRFFITINSWRFTDKWNTSCLI